MLSKLTQFAQFFKKITTETFLVLYYNTNFKILINRIK